METLVYGPGNALVHAGTDTVRIIDNVSEEKPVVAARNTMVKTVVEHSIPDFLRGAELQALVGLGPGSVHKVAQKLPHKLGLRRFSYCLRADPAADGLLILDDQDRAADRRFAELESIGESNWEVAVSDIRAVRPSPTGGDSVTASKEMCD